ncbi:glycosyl hydrolase 115 family protein, partial [Flavonifractor hominis]
MSTHLRRILALVLTLTLLLGMVPAMAAQPTAPATGTLVSTTGSSEDFPLYASGKTATLWVDETEETPVKRVVNDLQDDVQRVTGATPSISHEAEVQGPVVIVGTLDNSAKIQELVQSGVITEDELAAIQDQWEAYLIKVVDADTLVIAGSDNRGAIYGVYELSEQMGVSPWYFFADVPTQAKNAVYIPAGTNVTDKPDVRYRGIFINDEEKLSRWVSNVFNPEYGGSGVMGAEIYAKIFELILRLKGNYIWAAMHVNSFNNIQENIDTLHEYGIVLGSSHCDMLLRTNTHEWSSWKSAYDKEHGTNIQYDYTVNPEAVLQYWRENVERHKDTEAQWTLGMRGAHDEPFNTANIDDPKWDKYGEDEEDRKAGVLSEIIAAQQEILKEVLGEEKYNEAFMAFIPYKEVLPLYNNENFTMSDDVTVIWCDDNHGMVRRTPDAEERQRSGGSGLYYHVSYWAPADQSYLWMSSLPLSVMGEELSKCWESGIQRSWVLNVGDIKPNEGEMEYFIRCGWDVDQYTGHAEEFEADWMARNFGSAVDAEEVADILTTFYAHTNVRKVDHMRLDIFEQVNYNEWDKRMQVYQDLFDRTNAVAAGLNEEQATAFYELVQCKINWAYYTNKAFYYADKSNLAYDQGRMASADTFSQLSIQADNDRRAEIQKYSEIADGKWYMFIDPENHAPPVTTQLPGTSPALVLGETAMGVAVQGEEMPTTEASQLSFSHYNLDGKYIDIFNQGAGSFDWTASADADWVKLSAVSGTVCDEQRIWVTVDNAPVEGGTAAITITSGETVKTVNVTVAPKAELPEDFDGYVEADGYVSMQAEHYSTLNSVGEMTWQLRENAGRGFDGDMMRAMNPALSAVEGEISSATSPSLEYNFYLTSSGSFPLEVYRLPTMNASPGGQVRFAISVDDGEPIVVSSTAVDEGTTSSQNPQWVQNLFRQIEKHVITLPELSAGAHTLKLWMVDDFITIDKMVLYTGGDGIPASALGPDESYHTTYNTTFTASVPTLERESVPAESKDIPSTWGSGYFLEQGGQVGLEAEYAMENVLESLDEVTEDMNAYTVSKREAAAAAGKTPNAWRITQSDTGLAVRLPDIGAALTENGEFQQYGPELSYKIDFSNTGTYHVWVRWRLVDNAGDSIRGGIDHRYDGSFNTAQLWSYENDEHWHWQDLGTMKVTQTGVQTFGLWMREDGLYIDRIYLTTGSETPSDDGWWTSLRSESNDPAAISQSLLRSVNAERAELEQTSYPLGEGAGCYGQAEYDALLSALDAAQQLAQTGSTTAEQATAALNSIADAKQALADSLNLTENGVSYHAYRDFSEDTVGKQPYGFDIEALTNGATATVQEENGNRFLRLTTGSTSGKANLFLPYAGEVTASEGQRTVVEFRARFTGSFQYANGAMLRNESSGPKYAMVVAFENANQVHEIRVQSGGSKKKVCNFESGQWYTFKMVGDWTNNTYDVYVNDELLADDYTFRDTSGTKLLGQFFGIDGYANGTMDYDDFRVTVVDAETITAIGGTVAVTGTPQHGAVLTADVSAITPAEAQAGLQYAWTRDDGVLVGTGSTYVPTEADVGHTLTLTVTGAGAYLGSVTSDPTQAVAAADDAVAKALKEKVDAKRAEMDKNSYPLGDGVGCYSQSAYDTLTGALDAAGTAAENPSLTQDEADRLWSAVTDAQAALDASLNLSDGSTDYYAYRDFSADEIGKLPYGIDVTSLDDGCTATVMEEDGNQFLRLTTNTGSRPHANFFLPYAEEITTGADEQVVIELRARFRNGCQYANVCLPQTQDGKHSMTVAFENADGVHQVKVVDGSSKNNVKSFDYDTWYSFKLVGSLATQTYTVYMNDEIIAENYAFRNPTTSLTGQIFGIDGLSNGQVDYDDFKVYVTSTQPEPETYAVTYTLTNLTAEGAPAQVEEGQPLNVTLTAEEGYTLPETVTVTMAGEALTAGEGYTYDSETGSLSIAAVTGDVVITAAGEAEVLPPVVTGVTVSPATASVQVGTTQQFTAV